MLFVGHLGDRMVSPQPFATPWSASTQLRTSAVEAMQRHLTRIGLYSDKVDGKAGMKTRAALGAYQKSAGLKVDCWPSEAVLRAIGAARWEQRSFQGTPSSLQRKTRPNIGRVSESRANPRRAGQISRRPRRGDRRQP